MAKVPRPPKPVTLLTGRKLLGLVATIDLFPWILMLVDVLARTKRPAAAAWRIGRETSSKR